MNIKLTIILTLTISVVLSLLTCNTISHVVKNNYFCTDLNISKECYKLSSTSKTCYPHFNDYSDKKLCRSGWILMEE